LKRQPVAAERPPLGVAQAGASDVGHVGPHSSQPLRQRLGEQVAGLLLTAIRLYEFLPDERLPSEAELCTQLGVNRMAIREGLRWLEDNQYIQMRRGRYGGAYVVATGLDVAVERIRGKAANLADLFEYRRAIEPVVAGLAAERIGERELARLERLHAQETQDPPIDRNRVRAIDVAFHKIIVVATRNEYLIAAVKDIRIWIAPGLDLLDASRARGKQSVDSHGRLIQCLRDHDATGATAAMRKHIGVTERAVLDVLVARGISDGIVRPSSAPAAGTSAKSRRAIGKTDA
jgi:GntR family transcriptional repressor for pyruvate dehydrogenase complex